MKSRYLLIFSSNLNLFYRLRVFIVEVIINMQLTMNTDKNRTSLLLLARLMKTERPKLLCYAYYRLGNEADAQDAVQDAFLRMTQKLSDSSGEIGNLKCYVFRILSNLCSSRMAHDYRVHTISIDNQLNVAATGEEDNREEEFKRISRLLDILPEEQAEVIKLRIYGNNSFAEIAEILSVPLPTVKSRFLYGLTKLRRAMKDEKRTEA